MFAFHHFDTDNSGFITAENLHECFKREGKHLTQEEVQQLLGEVEPSKAGKISFEEFKNFMSQLIATESSSPTFKR